MYFEHYKAPVPYDALAENLVNTRHAGLDAPDHLATPADLDAFLAHNGILGLRRATTADLKAIWELRSETRKIFESATAGRATTRLNRLLASAKLDLRVGAEDGRARLDWTATRSSELPATVRAAVALNLAFVLERYGFDRLGVCQSNPCWDVFVDTSKRGGRRFCGPTCATRFHVSRYRRRQRGEES